MCLHFVLLEFAMADISYRRLLAEYRKRDNFAEVFRCALDDVAGKAVFRSQRLILSQLVRFDLIISAK